MKPVIALVGRPNVGKSTLFNRLTKTRDALVADMPGVTRDRQYGEGIVGDRPYIVIDTGGLSGEDEGIDTLMQSQVYQAMKEANIILFLVDGRGGITGHDQTIAQYLRELGKDILILVNKAEGMNEDVVEAEFYALGLGQPYAVSSSHGDGIAPLMEKILGDIPEDEEGEADEDSYAKSGIKLAIVGRPNVGKSTLINRLMGEERVVAFDMPGTTRDSIFIPFERDGQRYTFIDTAGVRRRSRVKETIEKFSIIKALQAIESANVVIIMLDAHEGITDQDLHLLSYVIDTGRALIIAINKWDGMTKEAREFVKEQLERRLPFLDYAKYHYISALHGSGVGLLYDSVDKAYDSAMKRHQPAKLSSLLEEAVQMHQPPLARGRRIKLRYAHQGGQNPPLIVIHGSQTEHIPESYKRYLMNSFRKWLKLEATPIRLEFKNSTNPYRGTRRNNDKTKQLLLKRHRQTKNMAKKFSGKKNKRTNR
ncbi:ribosome biogenesis GTPase Der [sulfur-oxidizing endosymbiont of Gigantopelta aegis]|uniref:ribosome biogenesis GTPase Der n=1 Tax=sulfur-oxidizing endosymbiont of Gigantopelta aegis TaxID=2794934 RepID=UPI0018DD0280|nr:ribosome biogenesis GTPase Der [sulfur-oxidizing endosymbiont of Gigantopelta aegis]